MGFVTSEAPRGLLGRGACGVCLGASLGALRTQQTPGKEGSGVLVAYRSPLSSVLGLAEGTYCIVDCRHRRASAQVSIVRCHVTHVLVQQTLHRHAAYAYAPREHSLAVSPHVHYFSHHLVHVARADCLDDIVMMQTYKYCR